MEDSRVRGASGTGVEPVGADGKRLRCPMSLDERDDGRPFSNNVGAPAIFGSFLCALLDLSPRIP